MTEGIEDKFDTDGAENLVVIGYPQNKKHLPDLIFWSCFPNDPVCWVTYPYINTLKDEILAEAMSEFMKFHLSVGQEEIVETACECFVFEGRKHIVPMILRLTNCQKVREWFAT